MPQSFHKSRAVIVLPPGRHGGVARQDHRKWLSRGRIRATDNVQEMLAAVLREIGHALPPEGLAALRFWGQTGERSGAWMAAADPVYLEARLDHLCLYALPEPEITAAHVRDIFDYLQKTFGDDNRYAFARLGRLAYLRGEEPIATAAVSPDVVNGRAPDDFMPAGNAAAAHDLLLSEIQMALHEHEVNQQRIAAGKRPVNSIWLWGGGNAPDIHARAIPPLFADEPLFRGYWASCDGEIDRWTADFDQILGTAADGFVAVVPDEAGLSRSEAMSAGPEDLRKILKWGDLRKLTLMCRDGLSIDIGKHDSLRFWRRVSPLLMDANGDGQQR